MPDANFQDMSLTQTSPQQPGVRTMAAAATIAPTTPLTVLTGTTVVATITPPVSGFHIIGIVAGTTTAAFTTSGNIVGATTAAVTTQPILFAYNPLTGQYLRTIVA